MILGLNWQEIVNDLVVLGAATLVWMWKRSIYGRMDRFEVKQDAMKLELERGIETAKETAKNAVEYAERQAERESREIRHTVEREVQLIKEGFVPLNACDLARSGCKGLLLEKIEAGFEAQAAHSEAQAGRSADIMERLNLLIRRFDAHVNGGSK